MRLFAILALTLSIFLATVAHAATTITATLTITNSANLTNAVAISNALLVLNGDTRKYTNNLASPSTQILINGSIGTNIVQQVAQTVAHANLFKFAGTVLSTDGITNVTWRGTNDVAMALSIHPDTWGYVTYATQGVPSPLGLLSVSVPAENLPTATATNVFTRVWDALMKYSQIRDWTNANRGTFGLLSVTGLTTLQAGQRISTHGVTNDFSLTTNYYWIGITPTSGPVKITLPTAALTSNQVWIIADEFGSAGTNSITVTNAGGDRIRGALSVGISNNFGALFILSRGGTNFSATRWNALETAGDISTAANLAPGAFTPFDSKSGSALRFNALTNGPGLRSSSNNNVVTLIIANSVNVDNILATNSLARMRSLVDSLNTTNQIDVASGPQCYYWTNLATNIVLQCTNVWTAGVTNRTIDFFFTGHAADPFTVTFDCPNPAGVAFRWGMFSATNGLTSFTVTNGLCVGASLTFWETNLAEAYFSPVR